MITDLLFTPAVQASERLRGRFEVNNILCTVLGAGLLSTGVAKVVATGFVVQTFPDSTLSQGALVAIGLVELLAAVLTIIPTSRLIGSSLISLVMLGATTYHMMRGEPLSALIPLSALALAMASFLIEYSLRRAELQLSPVSTR